MSLNMKAVDKVEIVTLQDNFVDVVAQDNNQIVSRALPLEKGVIKNSILAEHGFAAVVTITADGSRRSILFDFGFSAQGAAFNADVLGLDMKSVEALVLSHGHPDHVGGLEELTRRVDRPGVPLILHPAAFRSPRYNKTPTGMKIFFPPFTRERIRAVGAEPVETAEPFSLLDETVIFLGQIPKKTEFEKTVPSFCYEEGGQERIDAIEDDTAIAIKVKGQGLVVLSGCAHSGIVNTVKYAQEVSGINEVLAIMGGFHLTGAYFEPIIAPTIQALKQINPTYILPTHCTGRKAVMDIEREMPDKFLLNMSGTKLTFNA